MHIDTEMSNTNNDTKTIGQKLYDFLIVDDWLDLTLGLSLWFSSFFFFNLTFIVSAYMFLKVFVLLIGKIPIARFDIIASDDSRTIGKLIAYSYAALIAFFLLSIINVPIIGTVLTMIPCVKTLIFTLIIIAGSPIKPFLNIIEKIFKPQPTILTLMNLSVGESIMYLIKPDTYKDLIFNVNIFSKIGSNVLGMCFDNLLASQYIVSQSNDINLQLTILRKKLIDTNNLPKLITNFSQVQTVLSDLTMVSGKTMDDDEKSTLLNKCIGMMITILA